MINEYLTNDLNCLTNTRRTLFARYFVKFNTKFDTVIQRGICDKSDNRIDFGSNQFWMRSNFGYDIFG